LLPGLNYRISYFRNYSSIIG